MKSKLSIVYAAAGAVLVIAFRFVMMPQEQLVNEPLHSAMEAVEALSVLLMAFFLLSGRKEETGSKLLLPALGFLGMGILDSVHAAAGPGDQLVFLRTAASLAGGFGFSFAWLPARYQGAFRRKSVVWTVAAGSLTLLVLGYAFPGLLPVMARQGTFTGAAVTINVLAGMLFLGGAYRFMLDLRRSGDPEDLMFSLIGVFYGLSGVTFQYSRLWSEAWWFWHVLRLLGSLMVLGLLIHRHLQSVTTLTAFLLERKHAEEEVNRVNRRLELILHSAGEGILGVDLRGNHTFINDAASAMLGYAPAELIGRHSHSMYHYTRPDGKPYPPEECPIYAAYRDGASHSGEELFWKKDGTPFHVDFTSRPIIESGTITGAVVTFNDISERKRTEEALKLTQFSVDHASASAFLIAKDARILYVNEQACRTLGFSRQELLARMMYDLDPNFPASAWTAHWSELEKKGFLRFETLHSKKDGSVIPVDVSANYVAFGGKEYNWSFAQDITDRKRAESLLRQSYQLTKTIIDSMNDAISLLDVRDFTIIGVNSVFLKEYGYADESEIVGKHCYEITHHRSDACVPPDDVCPLVQTLRTGQHFAVDHVHYGRQGEKIYVEVSTSPIKDESGKVIQVVHVSRDITGRKRAEEERERLVADLARSNKELEQFAYVASHDLQEPLRMVASYVRLLEQKYKGQLDERADKYIHFAVDGALRMQKLIEGLLAYSRAATKAGEFKQVDMSRIYAEAVANLSAVIAESKAGVRADELPTVSGDEIQLLQLMQNLIGNAVKFRRPGVAPDVRVSAEKKKDEWVFSVRDNGIGIEKEYFDRVFQIFQRLHSQAEYAGTGLGLAVCKKIVERHHGRIWVESAPGQGTTFFFTLPSEQQLKQGMHGEGPLREVA